MPEANSQLYSQLQMFASRGVEFETAKKALLNAGWDEADISKAATGIHFGPTAQLNTGNAPASSHHLAAAAAMGKAAIDDDRIEARDRAILDGLASEYAPGIQAKLPYQSKFMDQLGIPWYVWLLGPVMLVIIAAVLHLPDWTITMAELLFAGYVMYAFYQRFRRRP